MKLDGVILFLTSPITGETIKNKKFKFYQFSYNSILSFGQSNVKSAHLVHRKYRASSDSAQSKINFKLSSLCANTSSQIFSTLMATDTISDLLKVEWVLHRLNTVDGLEIFSSV